MAERRMFTKKITDGDMFTSMPPTTQCLYFHLCMSADDDGFSNNIRMAMFNAHASTDDFNTLVNKRYIIPFDTGVIVIKHWNMHNYIQNDRYHETKFLEEKSQLVLKSNNVYSLKPTLATNCIQDVSILDTEDRIELDKDIYITVSKDTVCQTDTVQRVVDAWNDLSEYGIKSISKLSSTSNRYKSLIARIKQYSLDDVLQAIENIKNSDYLQGKVNDWQITFDWFVKPNNFPKVLEGNYNNKSSLTVATDENFQLTVKAYPVEVTNIRDSKKAWENAIRQMGDNKESLRKIYDAVKSYKEHCQSQNKYAKNFDKWIETELDYWIEKVG